MDRHEYFRHCIKIAKSALLDARVNTALSVPELIELSVDVDGLVCNWPLEVFRFSKHLDAYFTDVGELHTKSFVDCMTGLATYAMRADVYDCLDVARRELLSQAAE